MRNECRQLVDQRKLPSIAIAVAKDGRIIWKEAFGATTDTMYTLASTGKSVTGTALLVAAKKGIIDLDAPVRNYVPDLRVYEGDPNKVTIRALASMDAGIPHLWWHHWRDVPETPLSNAEIVRRYGIVTFPPNGEMHYSNLTFGVLAQAIENASRMPFGEFLRVHVFEPLRLNHTSLHPLPQYERFLPKHPSYWYSDPEGGAGYRASIDDLIRYAMFHLGNEVRGQQQIVDRAVLAAVHDPAKLSYRFGWGVIQDAGGPVTEIANGGIVGGASVIRLVPSANLAVAVLSNQPGRTVDSVADHVIAAFVPEFRGEFVVPPQFDRVAYAAEPEWVGTWSGEIRTWESATPVQITFTRDGGATMRVDRGPDVKLSGLARENGSVVATCACTVALSDTKGEPSKLNLELRRDGNRVYGSAKLVSTGPRTNFSLPAYIALAR
ncbi:MAG TPA: serine hydrolase domain-containing protein [Thermoanaerobaculia bacterium]|nr:serine hydrolase domain-containing protein [Thermoanaerobaculia bacterium]